MLSLSKHDGRMGRLAQGGALMLSLSKHDGRVGVAAQGEALMLSLLILSTRRRTKYEGRVCEAESRVDRN